MESHPDPSSTPAVHAGNSTQAGESEPRVIRVRTDHLPKCSVCRDILDPLERESGDRICRACRREMWWATAYARAGVSS